jgi:endonuclease YncB( thermonuclease family)
MARGLVVAALFCPATGLAQLEGVVTEVLDGDTVTIEVEGHSFQVNLAGIDAPELTQPLANAARQSLGELCYGREVTIEDVEIDRRRRIVGRLECDGVDAVAEQVWRGFARVLDTRIRDATLYAKQAEAQQAHRGVWATP